VAGEKAQVDTGKGEPVLGGDRSQEEKDGLRPTVCPLSPWETNKSPLSLWETNKSPLSLWERVRVRGAWSAITPHPSPLPEGEGAVAGLRPSIPPDSFSESNFPSIGGFS